MYKIIATYVLPTLEVQTRVWSYTCLEQAIKEVSIFKNRILSMGAKITLLRMYKTEEIEFSEMI